MKRTLMGTLLAGALAFAAPQAHADQTTSFWLNGDGLLSANGTLTYGANPNASSAWGTGVNTPSATPPMFQGLGDPLNSYLVSTASGSFSDAVLGLVDVPIVGVVADQFSLHFEPDQTIPYSFSWYLNVPGNLSYDELFYPDGAPQTCLNVNYGGVLDDYSLMFQLQNGDVVDVWSDGNTFPGSSATFYGAAVANADGVILDYHDNCVGQDCSGSLILSVPEPSTWSMLGLGFLGLGFAGLRTRRTGTSAA